MTPLTPQIVTDIHAKIFTSEVAHIFQPENIEEVVALVRRAKAEGASLALSGGRHAMGGQQFGTGNWLLDLRQLNAIHTLDTERGFLTAGAGIQWGALVEGYLELQGGIDCAQWGIRQKQTGADALTLGGALSANIHGRGVRLPPIVSDVESFLLVDAEGELRRCSREENRELFQRAIGGYGLFGVIVEVTLRLVPRQRIERRVELLTLAELVRIPEERETEDWLFGDFQYVTDETSPDFLLRGICSSYRSLPPLDTAPPDTPKTDEAHQELAAEDWKKLLYLAHTDRARAFVEYSGFYLSTHGQRYWSDTHQLTTYIDHYHDDIDRLTGATCPGSEMISELYVPRTALLEFMTRAGAFLRTTTIPVIYGTIRLIERDEETRLPWAREPWACIIFNLHVDHCPEGIEKVKGAFLGLIDIAIQLSGSFYLTYHRWASRAQVEQCHPAFPEFLEAKKRLDPEERFTSDWYRHYREAFSLKTVMGRNEIAQEAEPR